MPDTWDNSTEDDSLPPIPKQWKKKKNINSSPLVPMPKLIQTNNNSFVVLESDEE